MDPITRRTFLLRSGAGVAGTMIAGSLAEKLLASPLALATPPPTAATPFPGPLLDDMASVVADLEKKFPYASALYSSQRGVVITRDRNGKQVSESGFPTIGVSLRVFDGESFHESGVGGTSKDALSAAASDLARDLSVSKARYHVEPLEKHTQTWHTAMEKDPDSISLEERSGLIDQEFDRGNWNDPRVRNARATTDVVQLRRVFVDRTRRLANATTMVSHSMVVFGFDGGKPGFGFTRRVQQGGLEVAHLSDEELERMRKDLVESFGAEQMPAGEYEVVFAPEVTGLLAHESFGHGVEMDQFVKDRAKAREFLNKPVASRIVSLLDDPSVAGARGSYPFDDEGVLAKPTMVIKDGVFVQPLTDLMSATFLGTQRTPNGRAQSWERKVYARMSNTFIARGQSDPKEVLASLKDGYYIEGFRNGIEDPQGWGIQFTASTAREVRGGKFTGKLYAPATISGYVPEILGNITMVGNDFKLEPGTCGKGFKEWVPVTSGGPHIRTKARVS